MLAALNLDWEYANAIGDTRTGTRGSVKAEITDGLWVWMQPSWSPPPELMRLKRHQGRRTQGSQQLIWPICSDLSHYIGKDRAKLRLLPEQHR